MHPHPSGRSRFAPHGAFCLSWLARNVIFLVIVNSQIPIARLPAGAVQRAVGVFAGLQTLLLAFDLVGAQQVAPATYSPLGSPVTAVLQKYCLTCHDSEVKKGGLDLDNLSHADVAAHA